MKRKQPVPSEAPTRTVEITVDGIRRDLLVEDRELLLDTLRERVGAKAPKAGCYAGDCGACTVELDGKIVKSCLQLTAAVDGAEVTTLAGLVDPGEELDPIQQAFWDNDAFQCGFCLSGFVFAARDLLARNPDPSEEEIREAMVGNYCRCTGYVNYVAGVREAAGRISPDRSTLGPQR